MAQEKIEKEVAQMIIDCLSLEDITADEIIPKEPLFNEGLGLGSIDALELSVSLSKTLELSYAIMTVINRKYFHHYAL